MESPIFIVGIPRSGSTLWLNIVAKNENILRVGEMHFLSPWRKDFRYFLRKHGGDLSDEDNVESVVDLMFSDKCLPGVTGAFWHYDIAGLDTSELKKNVSKRISTSDKSIESIFKIIITEVVSARGFNRCCIKFPTYVNYVPELIKWFPDCKIVHITRDPRAIAVSKTNDPGGTKQRLDRVPKLRSLIKKGMMGYAVVQYIWTSRLHLKYLKYKNYSLFRYEDLLVDEERTVKELCGFTGIQFVPGMLDPKEGQMSSLTGERTRGFDRGAGSRWKGNISRLDRFIITMLTNKSMERFGFNPSVHPIYME